MKDITLIALSSAIAFTMCLAQIIGFYVILKWQKNKIKEQIENLKTVNSIYKNI